MASENVKSDLLLKEMKSALDSLSDQLKPMKEKVQEQKDGNKDENFDVKNGMSYLEMKYQLLNTYCSLLSFYCLLKVQGQPVQGHPVVVRLAHLKTLFEKLRPLDSKLQYQVDKLLRIAAIQEQAQALKTDQNNPNADQQNQNQQNNGVFGNQEQMLQFKPNISAIEDVNNAVNNQNQEMDSDDDESDKSESSVQDDDSSEDEKSKKNKKKSGKNTQDDNIYKAPKHNAVAFEDKQEMLAKKKQQYDKKRLGKTAFIEELRREAMDEPEELHMGAGRKTKAAKHEEIREQLEQENFKRVQLSKKEKKALKKQYQDDFEDKLDNFDDDLAAIDRLLPNIMNSSRSKGRVDDDEANNYSSANFNKSLKQIKKANNKKAFGNKGGNKSQSILGKRSRSKAGK